ncbi:hypothetical protein ACSFBF_07060 [Variovorax sp. ZT5P49]|uniref:hypothetical protein n=1 Tax=Variovorax sp. ZT5P49 TaxID=3443733 RepID=UPI003F4851A5
MSRAISGPVIRREMPQHVPDWDLVPLDPAKQSFSGRLPPVTEAERLAADRALNAKKPTPEWRDVEVHFALDQQNRGGL